MAENNQRQQPNNPKREQPGQGQPNREPQSGQRPNQDKQSQDKQGMGNRQGQGQGGQIPNQGGPDDKRDRR
jgi:hypothetical protein